MNLEGKVVVVTGASSGIGEATARAFAKEGSKVVINYLNGEERAKKIADEIAAEGGTALAIGVDVGSPQKVDFMFETIMDRFGRLDILVNNSAILDKHR